MQLNRLLPGLILCLFGAQLKADAQTCDMVRAIINSYYPKETPKQFYLCGEAPKELTTLQPDLMQRFLKDHFKPAETESFIDFIKSADFTVTRLGCKGRPVVNMSAKQAEKMLDRIERKGDGYGLRHSTYDLAVYYMSTPVYYKGYAFMLCMERLKKTWCYYKIIMLQQTKNGGWKILTTVDSGMYRYKSDAMRR